ncbi:MAG: hypothetical protein U9N34_07325, partial [Candidatus Cloacimonadota bacterium]|nr:hypothetical protein [Candidatus Cloacimonadota bacterium]
MLNSELMNFQYNFEGVKAAYHTNQKAKGALAFTQGKHNSTIIEGIEGKQGPYFIELASDNSGVKIIAGTESVFLDGILMNRGDDYRIEYDEGTITFYQKQIINSESIILVKFEYSDENFRKNVYLTSSQFDIPFGFDVWHNMMIQIDDKENPLADSFSEAELDTLQTYGDQEIWVSGITENEEGNYSLVDGNPSYYIYDDDGNYSITFSYVGQGNGNYQRLSFAEFEYVGEEIGSWIPQRKLIPAQEIANYNFGFSFSKHDIILDNEVVVSNYDENSYSSRDDNDNFGYVTHSSLKWKPDFDNILPKIAVGYRNFSKNLKQISSIENPTDSFNQSEFTKVDSVKRQEFSLNSSIDLYKKFALINNGKIEQYAGIGNRTSFDNRIRMQQFNWIPQSEFRFYSLDEDNFLEDFQKCTKNYSLLLNLKKKYWSTSNAITNTNFDSNQVNPTSEKKTFNITNSIQSEDLEKYSASISSRITKKEDRLNSDYQAITMQYRQLVQLENHIFNINYSRRKIDYNDNSIENDQKFDFLELVTSNKFMGRAFSIKNNYSIDNIEFYPKEKQLIFVGESVGLFDSTGVYSEEGEYDWDYVNIGEPELVTETKINTRISMQPSYIKILKDNDFFRRIKGDLYFIQSEKSYYKNKLRLYLFFPEATFNSDSSIFSRMNIRQTIWFDFIPKKFVTKYTFEHDKSFDNRYVTTYQR